jgi:hypothetical protein
MRSKKENKSEGLAGVIGEGRGSVRKKEQDREKRRHSRGSNTTTSDARCIKREARRKEGKDNSKQQTYRSYPRRARRQERLQLRRPPPRQLWP